MIVHGNGTIEQIEKSKPKARCRKWRLWATTDHGRKSKRFEGTYTEAQKALKGFVESLKGQVPCEETFGAYAASWLSWRRDSGRYAPGSIANYARDVKTLSRVLGDERLDTLTPDSCRAALSRIKHGGSASGMELSNTYMADIHSTLAAIVQQASDDGRIASNPMASVKAPRPDTKEKEWLEPSGISSLLDSLDAMGTNQWTSTIYLIACLGLRRGEAVALLDSDVEIEGDGYGGYVGTAHVRRALKEVTGEVDEPKTQSGVRDLPMPARLCAKVVEWREKRAAMGFGSAAPLCCNSDGGFIRTQNLARWWRLHRAALGCEGMGLHQLRHSNLSMMARRMSVFDLKDWAGWSSIAPARVYVHRDMDSMRCAVNDVWGML